MKRIRVMLFTLIIMLVGRSFGEYANEIDWQYGKPGVRVVTNAQSRAEAKAGFLAGSNYVDAAIGTVTPATIGGATAAQGSHADTAYGWGNHALAGYLTTYTETDPIAGPRLEKLEGRTNTWNAAYGWGDHALAGYLLTAATAGWETGPHLNWLTADTLPSGIVTNLANTTLTSINAVYYVMRTVSSAYRIRQGGGAPASVLGLYEPSTTGYFTNGLGWSMFVETTPDAIVYLSASPPLASGGYTFGPGAVPRMTSSGFGIGVGTIELGYGACVITNVYTNAIVVGGQIQGGNIAAGSVSAAAMAADALTALQPSYLPQRIYEVSSNEWLESSGYTNILHRRVDVVTNAAFSASLTGALAPLAGNTYRLGSTNGAVVVIGAPTVRTYISGSEVAYFYTTVSGGYFLGWTPAGGGGNIAYPPALAVTLETNVIHRYILPTSIPEQGVTNGQQGVALGLSGATSSQPSAPDSVVNKAYVDSRLASGCFLHNSSVALPTGYDAHGYAYAPTNPAAAFSRTYILFSAGSYVGSCATPSIVTNPSGPAVVQLYLSCPAGTTVSVVPEVYFTADRTNTLFAITNMLPQTVTAGTNVYTWAAPFETRVSSHIVRRLRVTAYTGYPQISVHGGGATDSYLSLNSYPDLSVLALASGVSASTLTPIVAVATGAVTTVEWSATPRINYIELATPTTITNSLANIGNCASNATVEVWINATSTNALAPVWDARLTWQDGTPEMTVTGLYKFVFSSACGTNIQARQMWPTRTPCSLLTVSTVNSHYAGYSGYSANLLTTSLATNTVRIAACDGNGYAVVDVIIYSSATVPSNAVMRLSGFPDTANATASTYPPLESGGYEQVYGADTPIDYDNRMRLLRWMIPPSTNVVNGRRSYILTARWETNPGAQNVSVYRVHWRQANELETAAYNAGWRP